MPYLTEALKARIDDNPVFGRGDPGVLAYRISQVMQDWLPSEPRYADMAALVGVLESTKLEFVRRVLTPYEDNKIQVNGEVWTKIIANLPIRIERLDDETQQ